MTLVPQQTQSNDRSVDTSGFIQQIKNRLEFEQSRRDIPKKFPKLPVIPAGRYTDPDFLKLERDFLWNRSWHYVCHADQIPLTGDYMLWSPGKSAVVMVRGRDGEIRAFYNTCRHRGAPLVKDSSGRLNGGFTCGYHGWSYDLAGKLLGVRDRRDFPGLDFDCLGLVPVRCESLGKWIFINEDSAAQALQDYLQPFTPQLGTFDPASIRHIDTRSFEIDCNVKIMIEGLLEVYHLKTLHPDTADRFLDYRHSSHSLFAHGHSMMVTPNRKPDWTDPGTVGMKEFAGADKLYRTTNVSINLFPGLVTPLSATGMPFLALYPTGDSSMRLDCHWFAPDWGGAERLPLWNRRLENFVRILEEDLNLVPQIQKSMESAGFKGVQVGYQERRIYHWHEELDRRLGVDRVPQHLRVQPLLAEFVEK